MIEIRNFIKIYEESFADNWDLPALTYYPTGKTITYGEMAKDIAAMHLFFKSIGLMPGDKVALCGRDTVEWVKIYMGVITYGAVIVPILCDFNPIDVTHIVNHSEAALFFVTESVWEHMEPENFLNVRGVLSIERFKLLHERENQEMGRDMKLLSRRFKSHHKHGFTAADIHYANRDNSELAEINYTSGTTGFSKGVMLSGRNLAGNVCFGIDSGLHFKTSRALSFLPLAHAYACAFDMLTPLAVGSHITLLGKTPSPRVLIKAMAEVRPNLVICVPLILEKIYKNQILPMISKGPVRWTLAVPFLDSLIYAKIRRRLIEVFGGEFEEVIVGGAPLNHEVEEFLHKIKFPFTVGYGMTECGPLISYAPWRQARPGSCGRVVDRMEVKVDSPDRTTVPGVIWVKGENVMLGYYKNDEATAQVFDADGWMTTGDIGCVDDDNFIYLRGRDKNMILGPSGQNIYPEEIEQKLNNMLFVSESVVIDDAGRLVALIHPDLDLLTQHQIGSEELQQIMADNISQLNKELPSYSQISKFDLMSEEFEKTPKRSIKRYLYQR